MYHKIITESCKESLLPGGFDIEAIMFILFFPIFTHKQKKIKLKLIEKVNAVLKYSKY